MCFALLLYQCTYSMGLQFLSLMANSSPTPSVCICFLMNISTGALKHPRALFVLSALCLALLYFGNILFLHCSGLDKCMFCLVWHKPCHHASMAIGDALGVVYIALGIWVSWVLTLAFNTIYRTIACLCSMKVILRHVYVCLVLINDLMLFPVLMEGFIYHPLLTTWY